MNPPLDLYYATMTGNAESLAYRTEAHALAAGWQPLVQNLANILPGDLPGERLALFIVSTWGDGEPPADVGDFWYALGKASLDLSGLRYAVLGLGDRDYGEFNAFARLLDERLATLGARRVHPRAEADLDFDDTYAAWLEGVFTALPLPVAAS